MLLLPASSAAAAQRRALLTAPSAAPAATKLPGFTVTPQPPPEPPMQAPAASGAAAQAPVSAGLLELAAGLEDGTLFLDGGRVDTVLSRALADGTAPPAPAQPPRPLKIEIRVYNTANDSAAAQVEEELRREVVPAVKSVLARSIAVRRPSGPLPVRAMLREVLDRYGPLAVTPRGQVAARADFSDLAGIEEIDADYAFGVFVVDPAVCEDGTARTDPLLVEEGTGRPLLGYTFYCARWPGSILANVRLLTHEIMHGLVYSYLYALLFPEAAGDVYTYATDNGNAYLATPSVRRQVQKHFGCERTPGALLDFGPETGHLNADVMRGNLMTPLFLSPSKTAASFDMKRLTDIDLALFQDSGWYRVKYGSSGYVPATYKSGCAYSVGAFDVASGDSAAAGAFCPGSLLESCNVAACLAGRLTAERPEPSFEDVIACARTTSGCEACTRDGSSVGLCADSAAPGGEATPLQPALVASTNGTTSLSLGRGLPAPLPPTADCTDEPFSRCASTGDAGSAQCVAMECTPEGQLYIEGAPCNEGPYGCASEQFLCRDPGTLTCRGSLNDCSGRGDCRGGACYCHIGWGGPDCSQPVCRGACADETPCPPSGFCGVDTCGEWSGDDPSDEGTPCGAS